MISIYCNELIQETNKNLFYAQLKKTCCILLVIFFVSFYCFKPLIKKTKSQENFPNSIEMNVNEALVKYPSIICQL